MHELYLSNFDDQTIFYWGLDQLIVFSDTLVKNLNHTKKIIIYQLLK
jgi:hypothetical protein